MSHQDPFPFQSNGFCFFHFQKGKDTTAHLRNSVRCQRERDDSKKRAGVRFAEDERGARVLRGAQEPLRWLRLSPYSCKLTPSLSKAKHSLERSGGRRGRRGGSFYFFFSYAHFHFDAQDQPPPSCHTPPVGFRGKGLQPNRKMLRPLQRASAALTLCARCRKKT